MNRQTLPIGLTAFVLLTSAAPLARADAVALGARLGTPGLGIEATAAVIKGVNVRANANFGGFSYTTPINLNSHNVAADIDFEASLHLRNFAGLVDLHPGGGGFRFTGGIVRNNNRIKLDATVTASVTINDEIYSATDVAGIMADAKLGHRWVPYAGIGYGNPFGTNRRVTFLVDIGVFFQGRPTVDLTARGVAQGTPGLDDDLNAAANDINENDLNKGYFKYYPVVSFGITFKLF
jgi:hypothetical protein